MKFTKQITILFAVFALSIASFAGTKSSARTALNSGDNQKVISLLADATMKSAEDNYLLGKAYLNEGDKESAIRAWNECMQINKDLSKRQKWTFLFPPSKKLKGKQKSALKSDFEDEFKSLKAAYKRALKNQSKTALNDAARKKIDARTITKKANAKTEAIKSKQRVADRQAKTRRPVVRRRGMPVSVWVVIAIVVIIIIIVVMSRRSDDEFEEAGFGTTRYSVDRDDSYFMSGAFWYMGSYFHSQDDYYRRHGSYYTNSMYLDNYDQYGSGQGRDSALDNEILSDIDEREDMRNESADLEGEAEHLEQDAEENNDLIEELDDSADQFEEEDEFEDDAEEDEEEEFEDDEEEFEDDEEE